MPRPTDSAAPGAAITLAPSAITVPMPAWQLPMVTGSQRQPIEAALNSMLLHGLQLVRSGQVRDVNALLAYLFEAFEELLEAHPATVLRYSDVSPTIDRFYAAQLVREVYLQSYPRWPVAAGSLTGR